MNSIRGCGNTQHTYVNVLQSDWWPVLSHTVFCPSAFYTIILMRTWKTCVNVGVWEGREPKDPAFIYLPDIRELKLGVTQSFFFFSFFFPLKFPEQTHKLSSLLLVQRWDQPWSKTAFPPFYQEFAFWTLRTPQSYKSLQNLSLLIVSLR